MAQFHSRNSRDLRANVGIRSRYKPRHISHPINPEILSPITSDSTLVCQGLNYSEHAAEAQQHTRRSNLIFAKASSSLTGPYSPIVRPTDVELLDYEVEIGLVLRTELTADAHVSNENIGHYVAGVVLCNDVSARDTMFGASFLQWFPSRWCR